MAKRSGDANGVESSASVPFWSRPFVIRADTISWLLVCVGIFLRVLEYGDNRGLYLDERLLLENLVATSIFDFHTVLTEDQLAPPMFLVIERLMVRLPFDHKITGRLVPFLCGIGSMLLFRAVARRYLQAHAAPIAIGLFALADWLLYYSAELKQYSSDLVLALCALLLAAGPIDHADRWPIGMSARWQVAIAIFGFVGVWLSYPLALVLAGMGTYLIVEAWWRRDRRNAVIFAAMSLAWALSFYGCYKVSHAILNKGRFIWDWWDFAFLRFPPESMAGLRMELLQIINVTNAPASVYTPLGVLTTALLSSGLFVVGAVSLGARWRGGLYLLLSPIAIALAASTLHQYPFHGRLLIFIVPSVHLLIAEGAYFLTRGLGPRATFLIGALLLAQPAFEAIEYRLVKPRTRSFDSHGDLRPDLLDYLDSLKHRRPDNPTTRVWP